MLARRIRPSVTPARTIRRHYVARQPIWTASRIVSQRAQRNASLQQPAFRRYFSTESVEQPLKPVESWSPAERIQQLRADLRRYAHAYFVENRSLIPDEEYDALMNELRDLEELFPQYKDAESPTQVVGAKSKRNNVPHRTQMLSLNNTYNTKEVQAFDERLKKTLGVNKLAYVCELKYDGGALSLQYKDGVFVRAVTRGDGAIGEDVTENAKVHIVDFPRKVDYKKLELGSEFEVRGEFFITKHEFTRSNNLLKELGGNRSSYSNPRNLACGIMGRIHQGKHIPTRLNFIGYSFITYDSPNPPKSHWESLQRLKAAGFNVDSYAERVEDINGVFDFIERKRVERPNLPFEIDGCVIKVDDVDLQTRMGATASAPRWAIAYKYSSQQAQTKLLDIKLQVGRTGKVTPVAIIEPVALGGITIARATLHNRAYIQQKKIKIGCMVTIERSADVIPKITGRADLPPEEQATEAEKTETETSDSKKSKRGKGKTSKKNESEIDESYDDGVNWKVCPCALKYPLSRVGKFDMYCTNPRCLEQLPRMIEHFIGREAVYIEALGPSRILELVNLGYLKDPADLFQLYKHRAALEQLEGWGSRSVSVILENIEAGKAISNLERVLFGLGIPSVGREVAITLAKEFGTIDALRNATKERIASIPGIGPKMCDSIYQYFHPTRSTPEETRAAQEAVDSLIQKLKDSGLNMSYSGYRSR